MKTSANLLLLTLLAISIHVKASVSKVRINASIVVKQEKQIRNFNGITIGGSIKTYVKIGDEESIRFEGDQDAIAQLVSEVKDGILIIKPKSKWNEWSKAFQHAKVSVFITAKKINSLTTSGSGSIELGDQLNTTDLALTVSGSGSIKTTSVNIKSLTAVISGSGSIQMTGKTNQSAVTISGSGQFNGRNISAEDLSATISGSGSIYINASKKINAVVTGSGTIYYKGDATIEKTVIGSGRIKKI